MKVLAIAIATFFAVNFVSAQDKTTKAVTKTETNTNTKPHVCTSACKGGKCVYAHGEKGHVCTAACKNTKPAATTKGGKS